MGLLPKTSFHLQMCLLNIVLSACAPPLIPMVWRIRQVLALAAAVERCSQTSRPRKCEQEKKRKLRTCAPPEGRTHVRTHTHIVRQQATVTNIVPLGRHRPGSKVSAVSINRGWCDWLRSDSVTAAFFDWFKNPKQPPQTNLAFQKKKGHV